MTLLEFLERVPDFLSYLILTAVGLIVLCALFRATTRKRVSLTDMRSVWTGEHPVHQHSDQWEIWRIEPAGGLLSWIFPSYVIVDSSGHRRGAAIFCGRSYRKFTKEDGTSITSPAKSAYSLSPTSEFYTREGLIAKVTANLAFREDKLQIVCAGRTVIMREVVFGPLLEGRAFFEGEQLLAESRAIGSIVGKTQAFCFHATVDENLRSLMLLYAIT